jgi:hypothetical protein
MYVDHGVLLRLVSLTRLISIASLLTHLLATCWAAYQLARTAEFEKHFDMITTNGACQINLLETYWTARRAAEVPGLVLNVVALGVSAFLSWRIIKVGRLGHCLLYARR